MRLITHSGTFHADEVFATAILRMFLNDKNGRIPVIRTNDPSIAQADDLVYDIGGGPLDHHQPGGNDERSNQVPYAACGLVWQYVGWEICSCDHVFYDVDKTLIQGIDAHDCGYRPGPQPTIRGMTVSNLITAYNAVWDDPGMDDPDYMDEQFQKACRLAYDILERVIQTAEANHRSIDNVETAIENSKDGIIILKKYSPWNGTVLRSRNPKAARARYVVFPSNRNGGWNWQAILKTPGTFKRRHEAPKAWWGLQDQELAAVTGVKDARFCHTTGFIGGCETLAGAVAMAKLAIKQGTSNM